MKEYQRITERRETPLVMSQWSGDSHSLKIYNRLAELENKIERGELISTIQDERGEQETTFFVKHDAKVCKEVVKECLQVLRDTRKAYPRDDYACGWNIGIGAAIERLTDRYNIGVEVEEWNTPRY